MLIPTTLVQEDNSTFGLTVLYDQVLQADAASFDVQNIPAGYKHLEGILVARGSAATTNIQARTIFNNDSGATQYVWQLISAGETAVAAAHDDGDPSIRMGDIPANTAPANESGVIRFHIPNYEDTTFYQTLNYENGMRYNTSNKEWTAGFGTWESQAAVNRITITASSENFKAGSRLTIYGLAGAPTFMSQAPGYELDYVQIISAVPITATTAATANTCITANPITFDGSTKICIETFSPYIGTGTTNLSSITVVLYDGSTQVGIIGFHGRGDGDDHVTVHYSRRYFIPSAGTHTYSIRAYRGAANGSFNAGAGGDDTFLPAYLRITRA